MTLNAHILRGAKEKQCFESTEVSPGFTSANSFVPRSGTVTTTCTSTCSGSYLYSSIDLRDATACLAGRQKSHRCWEAKMLL